MSPADEMSFSEYVHNGIESDSISVCEREEMASTFIVDDDVTIVDSSVSLPGWSSLMKASKRQPHFQLSGKSRGWNNCEALAEYSYFCTPPDTRETR